MIQNGWTALMSAARQNRKEIAVILLEKGADATMAMTVCLASDE